MRGQPHREPVYNVNAAQLVCLALEFVYTECLPHLVNVIIVIINLGSLHLLFKVQHPKGDLIVKKNMLVKYDRLKTNHH